MKYPFIRHSRKFYGKFDVVLKDRVIPCYNLETAKLIIRKLKERS